ncbi:hypothetical protein DFH05DRAFT_1202492 [Lentinula detonsa]|uniref:Uncharacterized protein n=1 Tax=Lentinula detonsa TaxID=2804962 RepID=A0A9W8TWT2_9AGAR|nr:hypothetical protein DFH05DRAFT_1202492 [Lentinula detonsa]
MFRLPVRRSYPWQITTISRFRTVKNVPKLDPKHQTDSLGLPLKPLWSVNALLSSYPKPELSASTFKSLHELSALIPPEEGTPEYTKLKRELEELVKLVEAVKLVDTEGVQPADLRPFLGDGEERGACDDDSMEELDESMGRALLKHASRTTENFYVVEADKQR